MKIPYSLLFVFCVAQLSSLQAQSTVYTMLGGLTAGNQKWNDGQDQSLLLKYHGAIRLETYTPENDKSSMFVQVGYHVKGSRQRFRFFTPGGGVNRNNTNYEFKNLSLILAAKSKQDFGVKHKFYYYGGLRGDYTLGTNLSTLAQNNPFFTIIYPSDGFVRKWIVGISGGGGLELNIKELVGAMVEFSVHPDLTLQYRQPAIGNIIDPNNPGNVITVPNRDIRNVTFEVSVGLRLIRKVVYVD
jgi:hypothetical protein